MFFPPKEMPLRVEAMPVPSGEPVPSGPKMPGSHGDARQPKKSKSKQAQQTKKRLTKKEQDEAAVQKFLSSPDFNGFLDAKVTMEVEKQLDKKRRSDMVDKVYNRAQKVMSQFAFLADGDLEVYKDEGDLLVEYMGKMTELQCRRKGGFERAERMARSEAYKKLLKRAERMARIECIIFQAHCTL